MSNSSVIDVESQAAHQATGALAAAPLAPLFANCPPYTYSTPGLDNAVYDVVRQYDYVTFAELPRRLAERGFRDTEGDASIELPGNTVLWVGLSVGLVESIRRLLAHRRLFLHPASTLIYMADGGLLDLPIAKQKTTYAKPHWLPVCLRIVPMVKIGRRGR